ncbi:MAG: hypothetical protein PHO37_02630 [Kiritimatiellae bacterium]|nr:hypothetical protein [Kiritimatiellia bacterium]
MSKNQVVVERGALVTFHQQTRSALASLTGIVNAQEGGFQAVDIIKTRIRNRIVLVYTGTWEQLNDLSSKVIGSDLFRMQFGLSTFALGNGQWWKE